MQQMPDLSHFFNTILPIIIFVIWFLISIFANAKKKQQARMKQQRSPDEYESQMTYSESTEEETTAEEKKGGMADDLKRSLETVFDEMGLPRPGEQFPEEEEEPRVEKKPVEIHTKAQPPVFETPESEYRKTLAELAAKENKILKAARSIAAMPAQGDLTHAILEGPDSIQADGILIDIDSHDDARKGVIWAEILGKPIALRDE